MKYVKLLAYGAALFFIGYVLTMILSNILYLEGGDGYVTASIYNQGARAIIVSITLLNSTLIVCTYLILKALSKK